MEYQADLTMPPCVEDSVHTPRSERAFEANASSPLCDDVTHDVITAFGTSCSTNSKRLMICWDNVGSSLSEEKEEKYEFPAILLPLRGENLARVTTRTPTSKN